MSVGKGSKTIRSKLPIYDMLAKRRIMTVEGQHTSSLVLNSLSNLIARSSQTSALVLLAPLLPGYKETSLLNCRQFAIKAYSVALEK